VSNKLDLYRIFWMVGKVKSFSQAAKSLYMTQPAVSQSIKQLEEELDIRLFHRTPKGVTLTNEGRILYEYVHSSLHLLRSGEQKMMEFRNLTFGELKIGVGDTISRHFLLPYLEDFHNKYPGIKFKIENGTTQELLTFLKAGEVDIVVCNLPVEDRNVEVIPCMDVQDTFVCGEKYKSILNQELEFKELDKLPLIFLEPNSNSRKYVEDYMLTEGVMLAPEFELGSHELLLDFAKINLGIACVTREFSMEYLQKGLVYEVQLKKEIPKRRIGICHLNTVSLPRSATRFIGLIEGAGS